VDDRANRIEAMLEESAAEMRRSEGTGRRERVILDETITVAAGSMETTVRPSPRPSHTADGAPAAHPRPSGVVTRRVTPSQGVAPVERSVSRPPPLRTPSFTDVISQFRKLHESHKARPLQGDDAASYAQLREDFARTVLAAQQIALK